MYSEQNLIWIDLEMTGLDTDNDLIIEMATIVTDSQLNILAEGPVLAIHQSDEVLAGMDEWNTRQHGGSGLTQRVRESRTTEAEAEAVFVKTAASCTVICLNWKRTFITVTWMYLHLKNWLRVGRQRCAMVLRRVKRI